VEWGSTEFCYTPIIQLQLTSTGYDLRCTSVSSSDPITHKGVILIAVDAVQESLRTSGAVSSLIHPRYRLLGWSTSSAWFTEPSLGTRVNIQHVGVFAVGTYVRDEGQCYGTQSILSGTGVYQGKEAWPRKTFCQEHRVCGTYCYIVHCLMLIRSRSVLKPKTLLTFFHPRMHAIWSRTWFSTCLSDLMDKMGKKWVATETGLWNVPWLCPPDMHWISLTLYMLVLTRLPSSWMVPNCPQTPFLLEFCRGPRWWAYIQVCEEPTC